MKKGSFQREATLGPILISALQNGQSGLCSLVSTHFIRHYSWKMWWHGVSLIKVTGRKSSTQIAQLCWFSLYWVCENFFFDRTLATNVSFNLFCSSKMRWAAIGSWTRLMYASSSSIAEFFLTRYLQKIMNEMQQQSPPKLKTVIVAIRNISVVGESGSMHRKAILFFSFWFKFSIEPHSVALLSNGFSKNLYLDPLKLMQDVEPVSLMTWS